MTDDEVIARQTALIGLMDKTLRGLRAAGVTAPNGITVETRVRRSDPDDVNGWFRNPNPNDRAVYWSATTARVQLYTLNPEGGRELCVEAPTAASAVALAAEIPQLRRWLGLPDPVVGVVETGGELYEVAHVR